VGYQQLGEVGEGHRAANPLTREQAREVWLQRERELQAAGYSGAPTEPAPAG
jgi:hypothetical protein